MYQIFSFFNINKTQEHTMNLNDLLNVELYNDNLKMFNLAWEVALHWLLVMILVKMFLRTCMSDK